MKSFLKTIAIVAALTAGTSGVAMAAKPAPAADAGAGSAVGVNGIGFANLEAVVANSAAFRDAQAKRPVQYKAQIDRAEARKTQIRAQLQPLVDKFQKDRAAPNANMGALQQEAQSIQQIQDAGNQELQKLVEPVGLSEAYVQEQINDKLPGAVQAAMSKNNITLLLGPQAVISASNAYNLNQAVLAELNAALPTAQLVPPAGWQPREQRDQQAQQAAAQGNGGSDGR
ncbi:MAG TPA: OmpH family outer membrane protein [Novosphingobium sp.]|nr:OmpH family outer membrane protein [Novosphingobium sp.]